ncbi:hypothetical protein K2X33_05535 [bacterium]|nr:hypothetical protein [bacterium]
MAGAVRKAKLRHLIFSGLLIVALVEVYSVLPARRLKVSRQPKHASGAIHVSAGDLGPVRARQLAKAAARAGLDFVIFADLDRTLESTALPGDEGVDLFSEIEVPTPAGHALYFYSHTDLAGSTPKRLRELAWKHYLGGESVGGSFLVVAHPASLFKPWERLDRYSEGVELINLKSQLEQQMLNRPLSFAVAFALAPLNSYLALMHLYDFPEREIQAWDASHPVSPGHFGIVGSDESSQMPWLDKAGLTLPPTELALGAASNAIILDAPLAKTATERQTQIYQALKEGRSAMVLHAIHPFEGNDWFVQCGEKQYRVGARFPWSQGCEMHVETPPGLGHKRIVFVRDGQKIAERTAAKPSETLALEGPGVYRVEVWVRQTSLLRLALNREAPYLMYNPLYVR